MQSTTLLEVEHYALGLAQDYYVLFLHLTQDLALSASRMQVLTLVNSSDPLNHSKLFAKLVSQVRPMSVIECLRGTAHQDPTLLLLSLQTHSCTASDLRALLHRTSSHGRNSESVPPPPPPFDTLAAKQLKTEHPDATLLELLSLAVNNYACEPVLQKEPSQCHAMYQSDAFFTVLGLYSTMVTLPCSLQPVPRAKRPRLLLLHESHSPSTEDRAVVAMKRALLQQAALTYAYETLFPATVPQVVKHKTKTITDWHDEIFV